MLRGEHLRQARSMLGWSQAHLARYAKLRPQTIERAEAAAGEAPITLAHEAALRKALARGGLALGESGPVRARAGT